MTWGQQDIWRLLYRYGDESWHFNLPRVVGLPPGSSTDAVLAALRRLVERNQSLRARFAGEPDGWPVQRIAAEGRFVVRIVRETSGAVRDRAEKVAADLAATPFSHEGEWGIRIALVCDGGQPKYVVFVISHVVADGAGFQALIDDFAELLGGAEPPPRWQPADQARLEQTARYDRRGNAALAYWRKHLERIPPARFGSPPLAPARPRFQRLRLQSRALAVAAARLADRHEVSAPTVVLAGTALALAARSGQRCCVLELVAGNRFDSQTRGLVAPMSARALFVAEFPGGSVADAIRAVHHAARAAYFYGQSDPGAVADLIRDVAAARRVDLDLSLIYNDLSQFADSACVLPAQTVLVPDTTWEGQDCKLYLAAVTGPEGCILDLVADTAFLPPPVMERLLRDIETIVTQEAQCESRS